MDDPRPGLSFEQLRQTNVPRCEQVFHKLTDWSPTDWSNAMAGEAGETCNLTKKLRRGEVIATERIAMELADVVIYADLLAARMGIDLGEAVRVKFNQVSEKRGSTFFL